MESRIRISLALIILVAVASSACSRSSKSDQVSSSIEAGTSLSESTTDHTNEISDNTEVAGSDVCAPGVPDKPIDQQLEDNSYYRVRFYIDRDFYYQDTYGITALVGVTEYSSDNLRYYSSDEVFAYNVGDILDIDEDVKIEISSMEVKSDCFIRDTYYGPDQEFIRISDDYIFIRPVNDGSDLWYDIKDYWLLARLSSNGNYDYLNDYIGNALITISPDCVIISGNDHLNWEYSGRASDPYGTPVGYIVSFDEFIDFVMSYMDSYNSPVCFEASIRISDNKVVSISIRDGDVICFPEDHS